MNNEQDYQCDFEVKKHWVLLPLEFIAEFKIVGDSAWANAIRNFQKCLKLDPQQPKLQQCVSNNLNRFLDDLKK